MDGLVEINFLHMHIEWKSYCVYGTHAQDSCSHCDSVRSWTHFNSSLAMTCECCVSTVTGMTLTGMSSLPLLFIVSCLSPPPSPSPLFLLPLPPPPSPSSFPLPVFPLPFSPSPHFPFPPPSPSPFPLPEILEQIPLPDNLGCDAVLFCSQHR